MKSRIQKYKQQLSEVKARVKSDLVEYFSKCDYSKDSRFIETHTISDRDSISEIYGSPGFYIILTDYEVGDNRCTFERGGQNAIYRGHCSEAKQRIMSHLLNDIYREDLNGGTGYIACLIIEEGVNGININEEPYSKNNWTVIVHKMLHSDQLMREQAEQAFDQLFAKPCKSRES